jgi:diguanylate cyclase (GGDEF)-like protein
LFIDLDNFKDINDTLGHEIGDKVLCEVADRFWKTVRESDTVGRFGGDEFVVLAEGAPQSDDPEALSARLRAALEASIHVSGLGNLPLTISASIGIASGIRQSATDLLRDADIALYRAKASGKNCCASFEPQMQKAILDRIELKRDLAIALDTGQFSLLYQPLVDLRTNRMCGVEALLRWNHPTRGVVGPDQFISTLEETRGIVEVGRWVLNEACREGAAWHRAGHDLSISINVSTCQVEMPGFVEHVAAAVRDNGLAPGALVLEITETALMRDAEGAVALLDALKELGVRLSIDDFGTGYSSLAYLRRFPVDEVKIDRSFVSTMASSESAAIIHTLVELSNTLGLTSVAEGIETREQFESLRDEGCQRGQGYFFATPGTRLFIDEILAGHTASGVKDSPLADFEVAHIS